jgi:Protein of unknown function (DUF2442)/Domain of unknown function (DUF4160)
VERFFFFSREDYEQPHIHVETAENAAKFWLSSVRLEWAIGDTAKVLRDATPEQRQHWRLIGRGIGIHWEDADEDISVASLLRV